MPKVVFTQTRVVQDEHVGTDKETRFEVGFAYDLSEESANRWIKRGVAVPAGDAKGDKPKSAAAPKKPRDDKKPDADKKPDDDKKPDGAGDAGDTKSLLS